MSDERWRIVGIHTNGYRHVLPIDWPTREKAEEVARVAKYLVAPGFRVVIEKVETEH
jgi:hypothetical protein